MKREEDRLFQTNGVAENAPEPKLYGLSKDLVHYCEYNNWLPKVKILDTSSLQ